ncbi:putative FHY3/FAR1 family protein [Helianthus annuus]|nr:putative FHY3/FAR1 family protein [Helianthus annuus]KAJ0543737.1 putative FHY3/FAR1 family protein [Helianthus annuus]KAJ0708792.1 putative FHY3/FAR1 family protein [Helianthus annuus]
MTHLCTFNKLFLLLGVFKYVYDNWLKDYKEMFVFAWTDQSRNFGQRTTNRVESQHTNLKRYVQDRSLLDRIVGCVQDIVETQYGEIRRSFLETIEKRMNHHRNLLFDHLRGKVSIQHLTC